MKKADIFYPSFSPCPSYREVTSKNSQIINCKYSVIILSQSCFMWYCGIKGHEEVSDQPFLGTLRKASRGHDAWVLWLRNFLSWERRWWWWGENLLGRRINTGRGRGSHVHCGRSSNEFGMVTVQNGKQKKLWTEGLPRSLEQFVFNPAAMGSSGGF